MNYLEQFITERGLRPKTAKNYRTIIKRYEKYCKCSIDELIEEAEKEEESGIRWKKRTLKTRLLGFRAELQSQISNNSINSYMNGVKAVYKHFEIEIQPLPRSTGGFDYVPAKFDDFLTNEDLKKVYARADRITRAMLLLMATSGITRYDICYTITVGDFIDGCKEYITSETLKEQLHEIGLKNIVPTLYLKRHKTDKYFYTFCTPECVEEIVRYLQVRMRKLEKKGETLNYNDRLFKINDLTLGYKLIELNDTLGFGKVGAYRKLRPHSLRKYHASKLLNTRLFTEEEVDALQGRSKDKIHSAYFKNDPQVLKKQYIKCIKELCIVNDTQLKLEEIVKEKQNLENKIDDQDVLIREILDTQKEMQKLME
jgi:integrase